MLEKWEELRRRYEELSQTLAQPETIADQKRWRELVRDHAALEEPVQAGRQLLAATQELEQARQMAGDCDPEIAALAQEETTALKARIEALEQQLRALLLPRDPNDDKNVILEIRAGAGGEEASLFGMDLLRMYERYCERMRYKMETISLSLSDLGGVKEAVFLISGQGAYSRLKFESGAHRVQRVPETESGGRIHTSAATVVVMPEADEVDLEINPSELQIDTYRSGGAGGQHVNKTESAIRITHLPTGLVVICQDERSQGKNRDKAMRVLKSRLLDRMQQEQESQISSQRKSLVGSGDRSGRIRTYNFPQGRVTDHRIGLTLHALPTFLQGDMNPVIDELILAEQAERLSNEA